VPGTVYSLSAPPPGGVLQSLTKNGSFLTPAPAVGFGYTLTGQTITLAAPTILDDELYATWLTQVEAFAIVGSPTGAQIAAQVSRSESRRANPLRRLGGFTRCSIR